METRAFLHLDKKYRKIFLHAEQLPIKRSMDTWFVKSFCVYASQSSLCKFNINIIQFDM